MWELTGGRFRIGQAGTRDAHSYDDTCDWDTRVRTATLRLLDGSKGHS